MSENTSNSAIVERLGDSLRLNIRLKGYVHHQHLYTIRQGNGSTTILLLEVFKLSLIHI